MPKQDCITVKILIADGSKAVRRAIRTAIEGFSSSPLAVFEASDGMEALQILADVNGGMDLVICDWRIPRVSGSTFLAHLKGLELPGNLSMIMIANEADRAQVAESMQGRGRDFILRPFTEKLLREKTMQARDRSAGDTSIMLHDLAERRRRAQAAGQTPVPAGDPALAKDLAFSGLSGTLDTLPIPDLIQILVSSRKTGHLRLMRGAEDAGIYFEEGEARHAWTRDLDGESAFFRIVAWKDAIFAFDSGLKPRELTLQHPTMTLLFEGLRQADENERKPS